MAYDMEWTGVEYQSFCYLVPSSRHATFKGWELNGPGDEAMAGMYPCDVFLDSVVGDL